MDSLPHYFVIYNIIAMCKYITKIDDTARFRNSREHLRLVTRKTQQRLSDNFKLSFHSGTHQGIGDVFRESEPFYKLLNTCPCQ